MQVLNSVKVMGGSVLLAGLLAAGCGGSGGGDSGPAAAPAASSSSAAAASSVASSVASSAAASSAAASSAAASSAAATTVGASSWSETFAAADGTTFFSSAYAAQPGTSTALYRQAGGTSGFASGQITLTNSRFVVGELSNTTTTASVTPGGIFNLASKACTLTVTAVAAGSGAGKFQVYVDNNTSSQSASPLGNPSRVVSVNAVDIVAGVNTFSWSSVGTATSFLQLRAESTATIVLDAISLSCI